MSALAPRFLISGLDTVQAAYYLRPTNGSTFSFESLLITKERLRADKVREGEPVSIGDWSFILQPYGSSSGYPLVLKNPQFTVECGEYNTPGFFVTFRSEALWQQGAKALHEHFLTWARSVGLVAVKVESLSRVDFAFDYLLPVVDFTEDSVVSLSSKDSQHRENGALQTLTFGRGDIVLRIYDKVAEIAQQSDKVWFFQLWGETEKVWRMEWQVRKDALQRFGLRTFEDLFAGQGDLLRYLATEHESIRVSNADSNRSRWPLHPLWRDLLAQIESFDSQGTYRSIDPQAALDERLLRMAISVYGYLKRIAAITGMQHAEDFVSLPTAQERMEQLVYRVHSPGAWRLDVQAKRDQMQLGNWQ
jgi:hypothetical protein